jgi:hypothetical protein
MKKWPASWITIMIPRTIRATTIFETIVSMKTLEMMRSGDDSF